MSPLPNPADPFNLPQRCWSCGAQEGELHSPTCDRKKVITNTPRPGETAAQTYARTAEARAKARLSTDSDKRKEVPIVSGCFDYFPDALAAVAELSFVGNQKHNPGEPLHWARGKSTDEADCLVRHLLERGAVDTDGIRHSVKVAWRALALLQKELEEVNGLPISRGSKP